MGWLSDALRFEVSHTKDLWKGIKSDPKRLVLGVDPLSTGAWNAVLGRDDQPLVNQVGGPLEENYQNAEAQGINTGPGRTAHGVAGTVAALYGGAAGGDALSWAGGGTGGTNLAQYAQLGQAANAGRPQPVSSSAPSMRSRMPAQPAGQPPGQAPAAGGDARKRTMLAQILRRR